jgi:hypothetical protein
VGEGGITRGENAATDRDVTAPSGWVTTQQAARSLGVSPRTVRWHIEHDNLKAKPQGEGVRRAWLVSIDSLQTFRDSRQRQGQSPRDYRASKDAADIGAEGGGNAIRELADRLVEEAARASEYRVRLELSEKAESTLREELAEERRRREEAERELAALRETQESPETVEEATDGAEPHSATEEAWDELGDERERRQMAENTLQEGMTEERRRREAAERERDELRQELVGIGRRTEAHEEADEQQGRGEPRPATGGAQEGAQRRPWWRRMFGG